MEELLGWAKKVTEVPPLPKLFHNPLNHGEKRGDLGTEGNPATIRQLLEERSLIKPGTFYKDGGSTKQMQAENPQTTVDYLVKRLKALEGASIPEGSKLNPASGRYILEHFGKFAEDIRKGREVFYYISDDPTAVGEVGSTEPEVVRRFLAKSEAAAAIKSFKVEGKRENKDATGYSEQDGWREDKAARRWLWNEVGTFENALEQIKRGVPLNKVTPVLLAQSMHELPLEYGQELLLEVTKGKYAGTVVPAVVLDCGDFSSQKYDIYTRLNETAYALNPDGPSINLHLLPDGSLKGRRKL